MTPFSEYPCNYQRAPNQTNHQEEVTIEDNKELIKIKRRTKPPYLTPLLSKHNRQFVVNNKKKRKIKIKIELYKDNHKTRPAKRLLLKANLFSAQVPNLGSKKPLT